MVVVTIDALIISNMGFCQYLGTFLPYEPVISIYSQHFIQSRGKLFDLSSSSSFAHRPIPAGISFTEY